MSMSIMKSCLKKKKPSLSYFSRFSLKIVLLLLAYFPLKRQKYMCYGRIHRYIEKHQEAALFIEWREIAK